MRILCLILLTLISAPVLAQRAAVVRGIGTQTCKTFIAASMADKPFELLGHMTGYFRQASDDPSRTISDDIVVRSVREICNNNADKTIDEAVAIAITSIPVTEVKKP